MSALCLLLFYEDSSERSQIQIITFDCSDYQSHVTHE